MKYQNPHRRTNNKKKGKPDRLLFDFREGVAETCVQLAQNLLDEKANQDLKKYVQKNLEHQDLYFRSIRLLVFRYLYLRVTQNDSDNLHSNSFIGFCRLTWNEDVFAPIESEQLYPLDELKNFSLTEPKLAEALSPLLEVTNDFNLTKFQPEYFGNIHESMLGLHPVYRDGVFQLLTAKGHTRKTTGAYYTPANLVNLLCDQVLDSSIQKKNIRICDPACGGGYFILEVARRISKSAHNFGELIKNQIYGFDIDPVAAEVTRMSLCYLNGDGDCQPKDLISTIQCVNTLLDDIILNQKFDILIGNPPWDKIEIEEREWFALRCPEIAKAGSAAKRRRMIAELEKNDPVLFQEFNEYRKRQETLCKQYRSKENFPNTGKGRNINTYALFVERSLTMLSKKGCAAFLTPLGIATEDTSKRLIDQLINQKMLRSIFGFQNKYFFDGVSSGMRFCAITFDQESKNKQAQFAFDLLKVEEIHEEKKVYNLSSKSISMLNPLSKTVPIFKNSDHMELLLKIYQNAPSWSEHSNAYAWPGTPKQQYNISDHGEALVRYEDATKKNDAYFNDRDEKLLPVIESKYFSQYNHRHASFLQDEKFEETVRSEANREINTRYLMAEKSHTRKSPLGALLVYRVITSLTSSPRTCIASLVPPYPCSNSCTTIVGCSRREQLALLAIMNSFAFDFAVRCKLPGNNLNVWIWKQLPFPTYERVNAPIFSGKNFIDWVYPKVAELTYTSESLSDFFPEITKPFAWDDDRREELKAEINAAVFYLFYLNKSELKQVMDSFLICEKAEKNTYGIFRSKELILSKYNNLRVFKTKSVSTQQDSVLSGP